MGPWLRRELAAALAAPESWLVLAGAQALAGLFFVLRLAAGNGGDLGGQLRELAAVLIPAACFLGAGTLGKGPRLAAGLVAPLPTYALVVARLAPVGVLVALGALGAVALPALLASHAPVDPGKLAGAAVALAALGLVAAALAAAAASLTGSRAAGGLIGLALALIGFGAEGLARATGLAGLARLDLAGPLGLAAVGWVAPAAYAPHVLLLPVALGLAVLGLDARRE